VGFASCKPADTLVVFLVFFITLVVVLVPCGRLSWLFVNFWSHVNIVYRQADIQMRALFNTVSALFSDAVLLVSCKILWESGAHKFVEHWSPLQSEHS